MTYRLLEEVPMLFAYYVDRLCAMGIRHVAVIVTVAMGLSEALQYLSRVRPILEITCMATRTLPKDRRQLGDIAMGRTRYRHFSGDVDIDSVAEVVIVTEGCTGALNSHILSDLCQARLPYIYST